MRMRVAGIGGVFVLIIAGVMLALPAEEEAQQKKAQPRQPNKAAVRAFMRAKLDASEKALEGLVTEDYVLIAQAADRMKVMSQQAEWNLLKTKEYAQYSAEFRRTTEQLGDAARERKLDGASLAFMQLTMNCVNCHKHVRSEFIAGAPDLEPVLRQVSLITNEVPE